MKWALGRRLLTVLFFLVLLANSPAQKSSWLFTHGPEAGSDHITGSCFLPDSKIAVTSYGSLKPFDAYGGITVGCSDIGGTYLAVHDTSGTPLWIRTAYGRLHAVASGIRGNIFAAGTGTAFCGGEAPNQYDTVGQRAVLACYSANGNLIWLAKEPPTPHSSWGIDLACDRSGNVYMAVVDYYNYYNALYGFYVVKYDNNGTRLWATPLSTYGRIIGLCADADGFVYITGEKHSATVTIGSKQLTEPNPMFIAKLDLNGTVLWAKSDGTSCGPHDMALSDDGSLFIAAQANGPNTFGSNTISPKSKRGYDVLLKYDTSGTNVWAKHLGGMTGRVVTALPDGGCFYSGTFGSVDPFISSSPSTTAYTVKGTDLFYAHISSNGQVQWLGFTDGKQNGIALPSTVTSGEGGYYLGGSYDGTITIGNSSAISGPENSYSFIVKLIDATKPPVSGGFEIDRGWLGVFPNPASMTINVRLTSKFSQPFRVAIQSLRGELLANQDVPAGTDQTEFDVSSLPPGCYLLEVTRGSDQPKLVTKVIIR